VQSSLLVLREDRKLTIMGRAGSLAKLVQQVTNVLVRNAAGPAAQLASDASSSCSARASFLVQNLQRREGSSLTTTSHDSVSAVTKSLLLDTLSLVRTFHTNLCTFNVALTKSSGRQAGLEACQGSASLITSSPLICQRAGVCRADAKVREDRSH
jgi:hypothetical protein